MKRRSTYSELQSVTVLHSPPREMRWQGKVHSLSRVRVAWEAARPTKRGRMVLRTCFLLRSLIIVLKPAVLIGGAGNYKFPGISTPPFW